MKRLTAFTEFECVLWLIKHDGEARWYWIKHYIFSRKSLYPAILDNFSDFGYTQTGKKIESLNLY